MSADDHVDILFGDTDPVVWAKTFIDTVYERPEIATDMGTMIGWFANAIGTGERAGEARERSRDLMEKLHELVFQVAGAATQPLLEDNPGYEFPSERVVANVSQVMAHFGLTRALPPKPEPEAMTGLSKAEHAEMAPPDARRSAYHNPA